MVGFHNFLYTAREELLFATYYTLEILVFFYSMINQIQCKYKDIIIVCSIAVIFLVILQTLFVDCEFIIKLIWKIVEYKKF